MRAASVLVLDVQTVEGAFWMLNYDEDLFEDLCVAALSLARANIVADAATGFAAAGFTRTTQRIAYLPPRADREQIERYREDESVRSSAVDACQHGFVPFVVRDAVGDRAPGPHEASLVDLQAKYAEVVGEAEALDYLRTAGAPPLP